MEKKQRVEGAPQTTAERAVGAVVREMTRGAFGKLPVDILGEIMPLLTLQDVKELRSASHGLQQDVFHVRGRWKTLRTKILDA